MVDGGGVWPKLVLVVKEHFRIRRELGQMLSADEVKQISNWFLYGVQHTIDAVGGPREGADLAARLRLLLNEDKIDEAYATVDAL